MPDFGRAPAPNAITEFADTNALPFSCRFCRAFAGSWWPRAMPGPC